MKRSVYVKSGVISPKHELQLRIARMMPNWLIYWCAVLVAANATTGVWEKNTTADRITAIEALKRWRIK